MTKAKPSANRHGTHATTHHVVAVTHAGNKRTSSSWSAKWLALAIVVITGGLGSFFLFSSHADSLQILYKIALPAQGPGAVYYTTSKDAVDYNVKQGWQLVASYPYVNEANSNPTAIYGGRYPGTNRYVFYTNPNSFPAGWTNIGIRFYESGSAAVPTGFCRSTASGFKLDTPCSTNPAPATAAPTPAKPVTIPVTPSATSAPKAGSTPVASQASHDPYGWYDFCSYSNNQTVLWGWAADPDAPAGALPSINFSLQQFVLKAGQAATSNPIPNPASFTLKSLLSGTVPTDGANYRDEAINAYIQANHAGDPRPGTYGFRIALTGLYKGSFYHLPTGSIANYGAGSNGSLAVNSTKYADGDRTRPYFTNELLPDVCLAPLPTNGQKGETKAALSVAPAAKPVTSTATPPAVYVNGTGSYSWTAQKETTFESGNFTVRNGNYALDVVNGKLVESFNGKAIWQDPATVSYPDNPKAKAAQLFFNSKGQLQVVDPNASQAHFAVWSSGSLTNASTQSYNLQLSRCGGVYVYLANSTGLSGGSTIIKDNAEKDPTCGTSNLPTGSRLSAGTSLFVGMSLASVDGMHKLVMQPSGTAAVYDQAGHIVWQVSGSGAVRLSMGNIGRLVLVNRSGDVVWSSGTAGDGGDYASLQNNGYFTIWASSIKKQNPVWENGISAKSCTEQKLVAEFPSTGGIRCVKTVNNVTNVTKPSPTVAQVPCKDIGNGKHECDFSLPTPVVNARNQSVGTFHIDGKNWVTCQVHGTHEVVHGSDKGSWWAHTIADGGQTGWVSTVYAKGGDNFGSFQDVPDCGNKWGNPPTALPSGHVATPRKTESAAKSPSGHQTSNSNVTSSQRPDCDLTHAHAFGQCIDPKKADCGDHGQYGFGTSQDAYHCGCQTGWSTQGAAPKGRSCQVPAKGGSVASFTYACQHPVGFSHLVSVQGSHTHAISTGDGAYDCACDVGYQQKHGKSHDSCEQLSKTVGNHLCTHKDGAITNCHDSCGADGQLGFGQSSSAADHTCYCYNHQGAYSPGREGIACVDLQTAIRSCANRSNGIYSNGSCHTPGYYALCKNTGGKITRAGSTYHGLGHGRNETITTYICHSYINGKNYSYQSTMLVNN